MYNNNFIGTWFNKYSKAEDIELYDIMENVREYAQRYLTLPEGYEYERWDTIPYELMQEYLVRNGYSMSDTMYLLVPNPSGKYASIKPDGGLIVVVKKDIGGNIVDWVPMLASEAKHQESAQGNAIERVFKNYNAIANLFKCEDIFPYVCFAQGTGFDSSFIQNKIRVAIGGEINHDVNIYNHEIYPGYGRKISQQVGNMFVRRKRWTPDEMYGRLISAMIQSYEYFFPDENEKTVRNNTETAMTVGR